MNPIVQLLFFCFVCKAQIFAQQDTSEWQTKPAVTLSGFVDVYYMYDFNQPTQNSRQPFLFNHNRHNEMNLNLGFIKLEASHSKYRSKLALQAGTYVNDNYASEPETYKSLFEANVGLSLNKKNNLWLDAGIFPSHIGFESAISSDNWTLTRSILAENSPYFLAGAKLGYTPTEKLSLTFLYLNGWQRIQRNSGNSMPSLGSQLTYKTAKNNTLNWSTFVGTEDPDSTRRMRYFNNFYGQFELTKNTGLIVGFDIGVQQIMKGSSQYDSWWSPVLIVQKKLNKKWKTAIRGEYYQDEKGVMITTNSGKAFETFGASLNLDYVPNDHLICRLETRWLHGDSKVFEVSNGFSQDNVVIGFSMVYKFFKELM
jgi:hypothetical protein